MPIPAGPGATPAGICALWVDPTTVSARPDMADATIDPATLADACASASGLLYALSGRRYPGICTSTVRPYGGARVDEGGLDLQLYPIQAVIAVKVDGETLAPDAYRVDGQRWLVRTDGQTWPADQRLHLPDSEIGTFAVTVMHGAEPPPAGVAAASTLAAELAKARSGLPNGLPRRITNITRQNVSITQVDPMTYLDQGRVGIWDVDLFLRTYNPNRQLARPLVFSPDLPRRRRV